MNNIYKEFLNTDMDFDRTIDDVFSLPYQEKDIQIQPNELAVSSTINLKLEKLYYNLLYIYGLCSVSDFKVPNVYSGWIGLTATDSTPVSSRIIQFFANNNFSSATPFYSGSELLSNLDNSFDCIYFNNVASYLKTGLIVAEKKAITIIGINQDNSPVELGKGQLLDPLSGTIAAENITSIATDGDKFLYVCDSVYNNIFVFDIRNSFSDDFVRSGRPFLNDLMGGYGEKFDQNKLNNPGKIVYAKNSLVVEDRGNKCFKVFDKNLNWLNTTIYNSFFDIASGFNSMVYNSYLDRIYAVNKNTMFELKLNSDFTVLSTNSYDFSSLLDPGEDILNINFTNYEPEIFYLVTKYQLIKKWITKPNSNIGIFTNTQVADREFAWATTVPIISTDMLYLMCRSQSLSSGFIGVFEDGLNLITLLKELDIEIYDLTDIQLMSGEYNQAWCYNKAFQKIMYNLTLLNSYVKYRFYVGENKFNTPVFVKRAYNNFVIKNQKIDINEYCNIGINENFESSTINRCLSLIYNYQQNMLNYIVNNDNVLTNLSPVR
jgi:hypothetical protein